MEEEKIGLLARGSFFLWFCVLLPVSDLLVDRQAGGIDFRFDGDLAYF